MTLMGSCIVQSTVGFEPVLKEDALLVLAM
jgi:hypothetical protein